MSKIIPARSLEGDTVTYRGKSYMVRTINVPKWGRGLTIGTVELQLALQKKNGDMKGEVEEQIDNCIFYYCTKEQMETLSDEELGEQIEMEIR